MALSLWWIGIFTFTLWGLLRRLVGWRRKARWAKYHGATDSPPTQNVMMVVLGSGGHTMEMLQLLGTLEPEQFPFGRVYVAAKGDASSLAKIAHFEIERPSLEQARYSAYVIPRARAVGQSWLTTPLTALLGLLKSVWVVYSEDPRIILCNGPGTCIPICVATGALKLFGILNARILFVESFARVKHLSMSAKIFYHLHLGTLAVQWPTLHRQYPRSKYSAILV